MNFPLLYPSEIGIDGGVYLSGDRALSFAQERDLREGATISVVIFGQARARARVIEWQPNQIRLEVFEQTAAPPKFPIHCIVGACRPQTVKKVIQFASTTGLASLQIVMADKSEKSYLSATVLEPDTLQRELVKAAEQSGDPEPLSVSVHRTFSWYLEHHLAPALEDNAQTLGFVADTQFAGRCALSSTDRIDPSQPVFIVIGPEGGWEKFEVDAFHNLGFRIVDLGERVLRVETALSVLAGQVLLLRQ